ncbi:MAG: hypothetical protein NW223_23620 [Hyphomicrobiaceae bacterium]|nr:hypothetical protein [Hyphomicrobiaceae bacterium]
MKTKTIRNRQVVEFPVAVAHSCNLPGVHLPWGAYEALLSALDKPVATRAKLEAAGRHTPAGVKAETRRAALRDLVPAVRRAQDAIATARAEQQSIRSKMVAKPLDDSPTAFLRRQEMRQHLKTLAPAAQAALLSGLGNPEFVAAAAEMPPELSGLSPAQHERAVTLTLQASFPAEVKQIQDIDECIAAVDSALRLIGLETPADTGISRDALERLAAVQPNVLAEAAADADKAEELLRQYVDPTRDDRVARIAEETGLPRSDAHGEREERRKALRAVLADTDPPAAA